VHTNGFRISEGPETDSIATCASNVYVQSTVHLSTFLQGVECQLLEAVNECKTVVEMLCSERDDDTVWNELFQTALDIAEPLCLVYCDNLIVCNLFNYTGKKILCIQTVFGFQKVQKRIV
jgi:hypothetical protein